MEWRDIVGYGGNYIVSDTGIVRSVARIVSRSNVTFQPIRQRDLKQRNDRDGYPSVVLSILGKRRTHKVHQLVARAFIENPMSLPQVNHEDGIKENNRSDNLTWCTLQKNHEHARQTGLIDHAGEKSSVAILSSEQVQRIVALRTSGMTYKEISEAVGATAGNVYKICSGGSWASVTGRKQRKPVGIKGESNVHAKITNAQALEIVRLHREGKTTREIMSIVGSSLQTTQKVFRGESWSSVTGIQKKPKSPKVQ
jgi:uncharacterized protein YerC